MPTFIKSGFWEKLCQKCTGYKGWLNLDKFVKDNALPYKVYTALLRQSGTDDPTAIVLQNTLGGEVTYQYDGFTGQYTVMLPIIYEPNTLWVSITNNNNETDAYWEYYDCYPEQAPCNIISLRNWKKPFTELQNGAYNVSLEIRIYS